MPHLPGNKLDGIVLEGLQVLEAGHEDLLQLPVGVGLEGHPGETLGAKMTETSSLTALTALAESSPPALKPTQQCAGLTLGPPLLPALRDWPRPAASSQLPSIQFEMPLYSARATEK